MRSEIDWVIHYCANGVKCACCDKFVTNYLPMMCNMHTHGLEKCGHPNFQIVLDFPMEISGRICLIFSFIITLLLIPCPVPL